VGDVLTEGIVESAGGKEVHSCSEKMFQVFLQPRQREVSGRSLEFYEEIDVTLRPCLVAGHGSE
jgi:hypothetical protein